MRYARPRDEIDALYNTARWRKLRVVILKRDYYLCQECKRRGLVAKGNIVHHITEAREDLSKFWNEDNLETICQACHNAEHPDRTGGSKKQKRKQHVVKFYSNNGVR